MSENEQTGPTGPGQPPQGEPAARTGADQETAGSTTTPSMPDLPWTPPPRRASAGPTRTTGAAAEPQVSTLEDPQGETADPTAGETAPRRADRRTRAARRTSGTAGAQGAADATETDAERDSSHPFDGMDPEPDGPGRARGPRRRGWVLWAVVGGAVAVVAAAVVAFVLLSGDDVEPAAQTVTTTIDVPTPTTEPLDRTGATALVQALPGTVRQFVLATVEPSDALDGALEAWTATYAGEVLGEDGTPVTADAGDAAPDDAASAATPSDGGDQSPAAEQPVGAPAFTVTIGQWEDAEQATAGAQALAADLGEPTTTEDVTVGDEVTGSLSYYPADGTSGTAVWTNGTVAIRVVGPSSELVNFATAFGL